jgi:hypothetical protein
MKEILYYHIWTPPQITKSILNDIDKYSPKEIKIYGAEEYEVDSIWSNNQYDDIKKKFVENNIKVDFIFGSADLDFYKDRYHFPNDNINVHLWPYFFLFFTFATIDIKKYKVLDKQQYTTPFISMNGNPHNHRCLLLDLMAKNSLIDKGSVSWNALNFECHYPWKWWKDSTTMILTDNFKNTGHQYDLPTEWHNSFLNLVSETATKTIFITEKTWIPVLCKKPFIVQAKHGFYKIFQELGFQLYDEIFDYGFDNETNLEKRTQLILDNVKAISDKNYNKMYKKLRPKIEHNYNQAIKILKDTDTVPELLKNNSYANQKYSGLLQHVNRILLQGNF